MTNLITITTDFKDQFATAQLHAVTKLLNYQGDLIENHSVAPFAIHSGAFEIATLTKFCPKNTIHVGVIDPGVGSKRRGIALKTRNFWFVGPDNGLLYLAANSDEIVQCFVLSEDHISDQVANTFHGRDVFIKAAIYLAQDKHPKDFGSIPLAQDELVQLNFEEGQVLHVDAYGNIKVYTNLNYKIGNILVINKDIKVPVVKTFTDVKIGEFLAYLGSSNTLELAVNQGNAAKFLNISVSNMLDLALA